MNVLFDQDDTELAELADRVVRELERNTPRRKRRPLTKLSVALARIDGRSVRVSYRGGEGNAAGYVFSDLGDVDVDAEFVPSAPETHRDADITLGIPAEQLGDSAARDQLGDALVQVLAIVP
jgi:hypothetical protein